MERLTSAQNPRLKRARRLSERRARLSTGLFIAEGEDLLAAALAAGVRPVEVFFNRLEPPVGGVDARVSAVARLVDTDLLRGIGSLAHPARAIAVFRREDLPRTAPEGAVVGLELHGVADPGNVGTLLRAVAALGPGAVRLGAGCADPSGPKAVRASMGSVFSVPALPLADGPARTDGRRIALDARGTPLADEDLAGPVTFVLGAEREGVPSDARADVDAVCRIPQEPEVDSLNVAMAGTVALYEARRQRGTP